MTRAGLPLMTELFKDGATYASACPGHEVTASRIDIILKIGIINLDLRKCDKICEQLDYPPLSQ